MIWSLPLALWIIPTKSVFAETCPPPEQIHFEVESVVERKSTGFTQGLEFRKGLLYESTGRIDDTTRLNKIDPATGSVETLKDHGSGVFGEGLTILNGKMYQITWKDRRMFEYDLDGKQTKETSYPRDGWGLTNNGKKIISSDGSDKLAFHDPSNIANFTTLSVKNNLGPVANLNELEYVNGKIYSNVLPTNTILRINPKTGCVEAEANLANIFDKFKKGQIDQILSNSEYVLNGIAFDGNSFYLTGKKWPVIVKAKVKKGAAPKKSVFGDKGPPLGGGKCDPKQADCKTSKTQKASAQR